MYHVHIHYLPVTKVQHLLQGLQATGDEAQQLSAVMEMCQVCPTFFDIVYNYAAFC